MKFLGFGFAVLLIVAVGIFTARTQTSQPALAPTRGEYTIISTGSGQFPETYVLDTRSGRVWQVRGQVSKTPALIPCMYQLLDGHNALSPYDGDTEIAMMNAAKKQASSKDTDDASAPKSGDETKKNSGELRLDELNPK